MNVQLLSFGRGLVTFAAALALACAARADGLQSLEHFLRSVQSGQGSFTQVVTSPPKQGETVGRSKTSSGTFAFQRPLKFRFHYLKPFEQLMLSDGRSLWFFDADLNQLTTRKLQEVMPGTPAVLLAGDSLKNLQKVFQLENAPDRDGLHWVLATPRVKDSALRSVSMGFRDAKDGGDVAVFEVADGFGQISKLQFSPMQHKAIAASEFVYKAKP
jgi:outer membrane lipoprotein carrier protein